VWLDTLEELARWLVGHHLGAPLLLRDWFAYE
jgi:hypothetical protein